jgi:hypothetical protein
MTFAMRYCNVLNFFWNELTMEKLFIQSFLTMLKSSNVGKRYLLNVMTLRQQGVEQSSQTGERPMGYAFIIGRAG